jgi:hypothetical protein
MFFSLGIFLIRLAQKRKKRKEISKMNSYFEGEEAEH